MIFKKIIFAIIFSICLVQKIYSQTVTNWGDSVYGVQLSIELTNNSLTVDSTNVLFVEIKNSSTNAVSMSGISGTDPALFLKNSSGKSYRLTPDYWHGLGTSISANYNPFVQTLIPKKIYEGTVPLIIGTNINVGDYTLKAIEHVEVAKKMGVLKVGSNSLKVQIK